MAGVFGFKQQLARGEIGEIIFFEANKKDLVRLDGFKSDFQLHTGEGVELKSDYWSMNETQNFFFERFSNEEKGTPGGPWQAKAHGSSLFAYFYIPNLTYFVFSVSQLVDALEGLIPTLKPFPVQNKNYTTIGYRVPRAAVEHLVLEKVELTVRKRERKWKKVEGDAE